MSETSISQRPAAPVFSSVAVAAPSSPADTSPADTKTSSQSIESQALNILMLYVPDSDCARQALDATKPQDAQDAAK